MEYWSWSFDSVRRNEKLKTYGLQLFNEAVQGKKLVYLYRIKSKAKDNDA